MFNVLATCMGIDIPDILPNITHIAVTLIKIAVPIGLIIYGMVDLGKAVMASDEKKIKEAQSLFIKRIVAAVLVFFIVAIVQLVFGVLANASQGTDTELDGDSINSCINTFLNGANS